MPIVDIKGIGKVDFADTLSHEQITQAIETDIIPRFQAQEREREKATGLMPAIRAGLTGVGGAYESGKYALGLGDREAVLASQEKQAKQYQGPSWEDVTQAYDQQGIIPALGKGYDFAKGAIGQSLPYMAAPAVGGAIGTAIMPGLGTAVGAGLGSLAQYFGTNIGRQVSEQEAAMQRGEAPQELSRSGALAAAVPQAALDVFALGKVFKGTPVAKLIGMEGDDAVKATAQKIVESGGSPSKLAGAAKGAGRGVIAELPTEVTQQVLERAQAGLPLYNEDAKKEYMEAAAGAVAMGGPLGTFGGVSERNASTNLAKMWEDRATSETDRYNKQQAAIAEAQKIEASGNLQAANQLRLDLLNQEEMGLPDLVAQDVAAVKAQQRADNPAYVDLTELEQDELNAILTERQKTGVHPATGDMYAPQMPKGIITPQYLTSIAVPKGKNAVRNALQGLDLNDVDNIQLARQKLEAIADSNAATAGVAADLLQTNPLFKTVDMVMREQAKQNADLAEQARQRRNQQLEDLRKSLVPPQPAPEVQNAPKEKGTAPAPEGATGPSLPSEAGVQDTSGGAEPSVGVYDGDVGQPGAEDRGISGGALGSAEPNAQAGVEAPSADGNTLTQDDILALLAEQGITKETPVVPYEQRLAQKQAEKAAPKTPADWEAILAAEGMPEDLEAIPTVEEETTAEAAARKKQERAAQRNMEAPLTGELSWDAMDEPADYRQVVAGAPVQGMSKDQTQGIVNNLTQGWKRGVNVIVKNFADEAPGRQNAMRAYGLDTAKGYIDHDGSVVILANNNKDEADIAATLFHESLGHLGLRLKFREELTNMMEKLYHTNADLKRAANKWLLDHKGEYDEKMPVNEKYAKAVEEVLAERSEAGRLPAGILDKIKALINKYLRKMGINKAYSDAEVRAILDQAQQEVTEKTGEAKVTGKQAPRAATADLDSLLEQTGRTVIEPEKTAPFQAAINTAKEVKAAPKKWVDLVETMVFSADAKINNEIRRSLQGKLEAGGTETQEALAQMFSASTSQALHNEAVAHEFIDQGNVKYDETLHKFVAEKDENSWHNMVKELKSIADQYGLTFNQMETYAQAALEARRLKGITEFNSKLEAEADALEAKGKKQAAEKQREEMKFSHMDADQIKAGNEFFNRIPELNKIVDMWNGIRKNAMKVAVDSGLYTEERAQDLLDIMDYVPFYRVEQLEAKAGPKEFSRGLLDAAREYRFKGSEQEVNNVFDNMERWTSYMIRRAVNNKTAQNLVQVSQDVLQEAKEVPKAQRGMEGNTVAIWQNGERKFYEFSDPLFVKAFTGLEPVALPAFKALSTFSNALRKNIVLNPLFSISQLSQDSFASMLTSGLKQPFRLPLEVMKEFVGTLRGTSEAHKELKAVGAAGVRDYSAAISRLDAEQAAGLKAPTTWQKLLAPLEKFSMASDNAVRQAVYKMTMEETGDKALAIERAFEIINFRRKGASGTLAIAGQVIPFFNAYLQAQNVAYKVLTQRGIAPSVRSEAKKVFIGNAVKISALALLYAAIMADDEDYKNMDPTIRDRHWIIPGTGMMLPVRTDLFSMPKIIAEHTYALMTDQGFEDGTKARRAMGDALVNAITGPTPVPQAFKPLVEVVLNRNFYTGRPIIGRGIENLKTSEQFVNSTSEFAKAIGSTGLIAPVNVDHLIRGYLGTTGGLTLMAMDNAINSASGVPKPSKSTQDILASTPGLSTFVSKEFGNSAKTDFYELKGLVDETTATLNRYKTQGRTEEYREYAKEEQTQNLQKVKQQVSMIQSNLSKLRERENAINAMPETRMSADQKETEIRKIRETEQRMLANVSKLRKQAGL